MQMDFTIVATKIRSEFQGKTLLTGQYGRRGTECDPRFRAIFVRLLY